jgi:CheY-like chemotaxis protein
MMDKGTLLILRAGSGNNIQPTFYFSWNMPATPGRIGADWYTTTSELQHHCRLPGDVAIQEPGNMMGPTIGRAFRDCWTETAGGIGRTTPRVAIREHDEPESACVPIPLYNPDEYDLGKKTGRNATLVVTGFIGFFLESVQGNEAYGRIFPVTGVSAATSPTPTAPPCICDPAGAVNGSTFSVIVTDRQRVSITARSAPPGCGRSSRVTDDRFPREGLTPDVVVVDGRAGTQSTMQTVERVRIAAPTANIFFVAQDAAPELILHSMRAGANEFLTWPPARETLDDAIRRMAARSGSHS